MHPDVGELVLARRTACLSDLTFVMRENQILTARVNVDHIAAEAFASHARTFNMPARITHAPRRFPFHDVRLIGLPEHEVGRMLLVGLIFVADASAGSGHQTIQSIAAQFSIGRKTFDTVINNTIRTNIRMTALQQLRNHFLHRVDELSRSENVFRFEGNLNPQRFRVGQERVHVILSDLVRIVGILDCAFGNFARLLVFLDTARGRVHLVFTGAVSIGIVSHVTDIRYIHDVMDFVAEEFECPANDVRKQERTKISDVGEVVNRRPAAVHSHAVRFDRLKSFRGVGERVVEPDVHRSVSSMLLQITVAESIFDRRRGSGSPIEFARG